MKLINATDYPRHFLRRAVSWVCRQIDCPVNLVREARFSRYHRVRGGAPTSTTAESAS